MKKRISSIFVLLITLSLSLFFFSCAKNKIQTKSDLNRIVSLGPAATEILFAIGAENQIVARTDFCNYPPEAKELPSVGGFSAADISLEKIISFEPTVVFLFPDMHADFIKPLQDLGIEVFLIYSRNIEELENEILSAGKITGCQEQAKNVVQKMKLEILDVQKKVSAIKENSINKNFNLFWQVWNEPLMSVGNSSFINDIIEKSGWQNIFFDIEQSYPIVSAEAVLKANPDLIVITGTSEIPLDKNQEDSSQLLRLVKKQNPKAKVLYYVDNDIFLRPSPRCVEAIKILSENIK